ncbi:MAG: hypothetical protein HMLKMBBP_03791 [Planctomycetes bacterium]|nr:hypothetical protein [Planctomycetota bacterium]
MSVVWNYANASHLLRRAGFGAPRKAVEKALRDGQERAVDRLLAPKPSGAFYDGRGDTAVAATWWLDRMLSGKAGLQEKLALFWHDHFATSVAKVEDPRLLARQNRLFRLHGAGPFSTLLLQVSRDPAMIWWLDNLYNVKDAPNENFAREVMELFSVGIADPDGNPNYTQQDVREAARAFTGWSIADRAFYFDADQHDFGAKTFMGETIEGGEEVVDILAAKRQTGIHLAGKLWRFFAYERPEREVVEALADVYVASGTGIAAVLRAMFLRDEFYSVRARTDRVSGPVDFTVGTIRTLGSGVRRRDWLPWNLAQMGQELFNPPNVAGWPGGLAWMTSVSRLNRMDFSWNLAVQRGRDAQFRFEPKKLFAGLKNPTAEEIVDRVLETLGVAASAETRSDLVAYITTRPDDTPVAPDLADREYVDIKIRGLVGLVLTLPEAALA